jgi:hypothetical protein
MMCHTQPSTIRVAHQNLMKGSKNHFDIYARLSTANVVADQIVSSLQLNIHFKTPHVWQRPRLQE